MNLSPARDLMPPAFDEGLDDWSRGDGTPDSPTYVGAANARIATNDADFGTCLELRKVETVQRLRYMGEVPLHAGACVAITARVKALRGPLPKVRVAAFAGGAQGREVAGLPAAGPSFPIDAHDTVYAVRAVIGPELLPGVDLVWDARVLYAHVGLDLTGPDGGVMRIERLQVRDVTTSLSAGGRGLPGFGPTDD